MKDSIVTPGKKTLHTYVAPPSKVVPMLYPESDDYRAMPEVFATGFMVGLLEWCAIIALRDVIDDGEDSLGTMIDIDHTTPTPPGARLNVTATCTRAEGNYFEWAVSAVDEEGDVAASGRHGRHVINTDRFMARVAKKAERLGCSRPRVART